VAVLSGGGARGSDRPILKDPFPRALLTVKLQRFAFLSVKFVDRVFWNRSGFPFPPPRTPFPLYGILRLPSEGRPSQRCYLLRAAPCKKVFFTVLGPL